MSNIVKSGIVWCSSGKVRSHTHTHTRMPTASSYTTEVKLNETVAC